MVRHVCPAPACCRNLLLSQSIGLCRLFCFCCVCRNMEPASSDVSTLAQELRGADDHTIINQYFDAIDKLVALVMEGHGAQAKDEGLCDAVLHLQDVSDSVTYL